MPPCCSQTGDGCAEETLQQAARAGSDAQGDVGSSVAQSVLGWGWVIHADLLLFLCVPKCLF